MRGRVVGNGNRRHRAAAGGAGRSTRRQPGVQFAAALIFAGACAWALPNALAREAGDAGPQVEITRTGNRFAVVPAGDQPWAASAPRHPTSAADATRAGQLYAPGSGLVVRGGYRNFELTGGYENGQALGAAPWLDLAAACVAGGSTAGCEAVRHPAYYLQGTYQFFGKTKFGLGYGEAAQALFHPTDSGLSPALATPNPRLKLWTVGVYHDVNSWLKLIAEYSNEHNNFQDNLPNGAGSLRGKTESDAFMIGSFFLW